MDYTASVRAFWLKSLTIALILAFACAPGTAARALGAAQPQPCPAEHGHRHQHGDVMSEPGQAHSLPATSHHEQERGCCCDVLSCSAAADIAAPYVFERSAYSTAVLAAAPVDALLGRILDPELDPPRPSALS